MVVITISAKIRKINNQQICYYRDNTIIELLSTFGVLNTKQLHYLVTYNNKKNGYKIIQRRMSKLVKQKKVKANKNYKPYIYYTKWDKSFIQVQHRIATVWGYIYISLLCLKPYEKIVKFTYEDN